VDEAVGESAELDAALVTVDVWAIRRFAEPR
jgi:hypothetical protein